MAVIQDAYKLTSSAATGGIKAATGALGGLKNAIGAIGKLGAAPFRGLMAGAGGAIKAIQGIFPLMEGLQKIGEIAGKVIEGVRNASPRAAGALDRIGERLQNFQTILFANIGERLAPLFEKIADVLSSPAFDNFINGFMGGLVKALDVVVPILTSFIDVLMADTNTGGFWKLLDNLQKSLEGVVGKEAAQIITDIVYAVKGFIEVLSGSLTLDTFTDRLDDMSEGGLTFWGVLSDVIKFVQENWPKVQAAIQVVGEKVGEIIGKVAEVIGKFIEENGPAIRAFFDGVFKTVGEIITGIYNVIVTILTQIAKFIDENQEGILKVIETIWNVISTSIETVLNTIKGIIDVAMLALQGDWQGAWDKVKSVFEGVWNGFVSIVTTIWEAIKAPIRDGINWVIDQLNGIIFKINEVLIASNTYLGTSFGGIPTIPRVSFAQGAIVSRPTMAVVGDNPTSPEVVAPLDDLVGILRQALGGTGQPIVVTINGPFGPGYSPYEAGQQAGQGIRDKLRSTGRV